MNKDTEKLVLIIVVSGAILIGTAYLVSQNTFGARCGAVFEQNTVQYEDCIHRLSKGGRVFRDEHGNEISSNKKVQKGK